MIHVFVSNTQDYYASKINTIDLLLSYKVHQLVTSKIIQKNVSIKLRCKNS
jgi:uncharacterized protein YktA (UPF0223 family)